MSEQRKRLTDKEREGLTGVVHFNRPGDPIATRARADLDADYLQAREDRKRLVKALRDRVWECECGPFRDDPEVEIYDMCLCSSCATDRALVAEVDPQ